MKVIWGGNPTIQQVAISSSPVYFYKGSVADASSIDFTNEDLCEAYGFIANDDKHYIFDDETDLLAWASNLPSPANRDQLVSLLKIGKQLAQSPSVLGRKHTLKLTMKSFLKITQTKSSLIGLINTVQ